MAHSRTDSQIDTCQEPVHGGGMDRGQKSNRARPCGQAWRNVLLFVATYAAVVTGLLAGPITFSIPQGTFTDSIEVALDAEDSNTAIRYTVDGSIPSDQNGVIYSQPIVLNETMQIRAVAMEGENAEVSSAHYIKLDADLANYESNLPILVIENFDAGRIPAKGWSSTGAGVKQRPRQPAMWAIFDRDPESGKTNLTKPPQMSSRIGIRGRGAFSTTWNEKPYSVEAWRNDSDQERKVFPLDLPGHSDWVLYFPQPDQNKDPTMVHNTFMYELSTVIGRYAARFRWVDVFVNENGGDLRASDRKGVYALLEKVSRGPDRLDFERLSEDGTSGGWLLNINRMDAAYEDGWPAPNGATRPQFFHTPGPNRRPQTPANQAGRGDDDPRQSNGFLNFDNPNGYRITEAQRAAIEGWFVEFENVLYDNEAWKDPVTGYRRYLDSVDFADYFVLHNLARNGDGLLISMFPWKNSRDDRLRMGPAWDFNWNSYDVSGGPTSSPMHRSDRLWYGRLFRDPDFEQLFIDRWFKHRRGAMSNGGIEEIIRSQAEEIGDANADAQGVSPATWHRRLDRMISWLHRRADWIDGRYSPIPMSNLRPGNVAAGTQLTLLAEREDAAIYYTTDGSDPRAPGGDIASKARLVGAASPLVVIDPQNRGWVSVPASDSNDQTWFAPEFDAAAEGWQESGSGVGFDVSGDYAPFISTDLQEAMRGINATVRLRLPFVLSEEQHQRVAGLILRVRFEDGFAAFLNGTRVIAANAPDELNWNAKATKSNADTAAVIAETFGLDGNIGLLKAGENVLALQGLNLSAGGSDMLLAPELEVGLAQEDPELSIDFTKRVIVRTVEDKDWSAPLDLQFFVGAEPANASNVMISEIHYHPSDPEENEFVPGSVNDRIYEFIELQNKGTRTVDLTGVEFDDGIRFRFSEESAILALPPGGFVVVTARSEAFEARYGRDVPVAGEFGGNLANGGERLILRARDGSTIADFAYGDGDGWPEAADGTGPSLVRTASGDPALVAHWSASAKNHGSPGRGEKKSFEGEPGEDRDGDGVSALVEFAVGASDFNPTDAHRAAPAVRHKDSALSIELRIDPSAAVTFSLWQSLDLIEWEIASDTVEIVEDSQSLRWHFPSPSIDSRDMFFRVVIKESNSP